MTQMRNLVKLLTLGRYGRTMGMQSVFIIPAQGLPTLSTYIPEHSVIRDGKRGFLGIFKHKYKSVARFYNQNFYDFYKMRLVDELLN